MGRIQSSVGLISGIPIAETVNQLIAIQGLARDRLVSRSKVLGAQQAAVTDLTALTLGVQFAIRRLKTSDLFAQKAVTSSDPSLLTATASSSASPGQYQFVPARLAQSHQAFSSGVAARDEALGGGAISFRIGGHIDSGASLADLNGGAGVSRGKIKITDRSGDSAVVDLRFAIKIDDVLSAINGSDDIAVTAHAVNDRIVLRDSSGGNGNLRVEESSGGATAADLGLAGINVASNEAAGQNLVQLFDGLQVSQLRDGAGLSLRSELPDLSIAFRDGTSLDVDLNPTGDGEVVTLGDILDQLNAADPARLEARISSDGLRIEVQDLTTGANAFAVTSALGGSVAEELGLTAPAAGDTITGDRVISGLKTTLLGSLSGGQGLGSLGLLNLTDRSGASASINLASAETIDDVIEAINAANVAITAGHNAARNGIQLTDTSGSTASNLIAANGDVSNTAAKLGIATSVAATQINSGSLNRQVVSRGTLLSTYKSGSAVSNGSFLITDSSGTSGAVNLTVLAPETIGDVIDAINGLNIDVEARINDAGDGIALIDTAGGSGTLTVADVGSGHAAADLRLTGSGEDTTIGGQPAQIIDGSTTITIELEADESLDDLVAKINEQAGGATATVLSEPSGSRRHHLSLLSGVTGTAGELLIDSTELGLSFSDLAAAQDAVLQVGGSATGLVIAGGSNRFSEALPGIDVSLVNASTETVTIAVSQTVSGVSSALALFVDNYNKLRDKLDLYTAFDPVAGTKGTLFGSSETLRIDSELSRLITGRHSNDGEVRTLAELGISINDRGELAFDKTRLEARYADDPESVTEFFADEDQGFAAKADSILEALVGADSSLLINRAETIQKQLDSFTERILTWNSRLERNRERLFLEFTRIEEVIARMQNNLSAIQQIQFVAPVATNSN